MHAIFNSTSPQAIAIPGFLELLDNVDFTVGKELARGGGGSVHLGLAINTETIRLAGAKQIVVKRVFENTSDKDESANTFFQEVAVMWLLNSGRNIAKVLG